MQVQTSYKDAKRPGRIRLTPLTVRVDEMIQMLRKRDQKSSLMAPGFFRRKTDRYLTIMIEDESTGVENIWTNIISVLKSSDERHASKLIIG